MVHLRDTAPEAQRVEVEVLRRLSVAQRLANVSGLNSLLRNLALAGLRQRFPETTSTEIEERYLALALGSGAATKVLKARRNRSPSSFAELRVMGMDPTELVVRVARILEDLAIPYHIGGSLAASAYGRQRSTQDADFVVDLRRDQLEALAGELERDFYVSREAMVEALRDRDCFNAIHSDTGFKIDFFILGTTPFDREEFRRRVPRSVKELGEAVVYFKAAEDLVLRKLDWFRRGGQVSENQWRDVLGILSVSRGQLDEHYLDTWAATLGLSDLLAKARVESELGGSSPR